MTKYFALYLSLFIGLGAYNTFLPVYLEGALGFTSTQVGLITSIPSIVGIIFVPIWGFVSDLLKRQKSILWFNALMSLLFTILYINTNSFFMIILVAAGLEMFRNSLLPLSDTLSTAYCKSTNKNYGQIRVVGSAAFAIASFLCGYLIKFTNKDVMFFYVFLVSMIACLIVVPSVKIFNDDTKKENINLSDLSKLFKNKNYILILIYAVTTTALTEAMMTYQGIHLVNLGAGADLVGLLTVFMVTPELYFMVKSKKLLEKYGITKMLTTASIILLIRWSIYLITSNPWVFMIATSLHGIAISILLICVFDFIGKVVDKKLYTTAMTTYTFIVGVSYSLMKLLYGKLIDLFSMNSIFIFSIIFTLLSFLIIKKINKGLN
jgi:oligosaccharide:H+ symporter